MQIHTKEEKNIKMSPELQTILNRLQVQLESMSDEEYQEQIVLIKQMSEGPSADDLIRSFHESPMNYVNVYQSDYNININPSNREYPITDSDYSLAA